MQCDVDTHQATQCVLVVDTRVYLHFCECYGNVLLIFFSIHTLGLASGKIARVFLPLQRVQIFKFVRYHVIMVCDACNGHSP